MFLIITSIAGSLNKCYRALLTFKLFIYRLSGSLCYLHQILILMSNRQVMYCSQYLLFKTIFTQGRNVYSVFKRFWAREPTFNKVSIYQHKFRRIKLNLGLHKSFLPSVSLCLQSQLAGYCLVSVNGITTYVASTNLVSQMIRILYSIAYYSKKSWL